MNFLVKNGIDPGQMSKLDSLKLLKDRLTDQTVFDKFVTKLWGTSGDLLSASCPHGVIYAMM
jgi:hypothetical protein